MEKQHILISRIDAIGDVTLTLPMCGYLKTVFPGITVSFLGRSYTEAVIKTCTSIDHFIDYDHLISLNETARISFLKSNQVDIFIHVFPDKHLAFLAKKSGIPVRIGTTNRLYHWLTCNKLVRLSRKRSDLHEAELNLRLLKGIGINTFPPFHLLPAYYNFTHIKALPAKLLELLSTDKFNLVLHPKSHGSGKEWPLRNYEQLIHLLPETDYKIFITGSGKESPVLTPWISGLPKNVINLTGLMNLDQLISFFHKADGLIASGTGPLHLAAASGINTLGLFPSTRSIHGGRWGPLGKKASYIESLSDNIEAIDAPEVYDRIKSWKIEKTP